jgi:hypothetical protein
MSRRPVIGKAMSMWYKKIRILILELMCLILEKRLTSKEKKVTM